MSGVVLGQVSSSVLTDALKSGVRGAGANNACYADALRGLRHLVHMTAALDLQAECEDAVSMLCVATGAYSPAPPGSLDEARQLQARIAHDRVFKCPPAARSAGTQTATHSRRRLLHGSKHRVQPYSTRSTHAGTARACIYRLGARRPAPGLCVVAAFARHVDIGGHG